MSKEVKRNLKHFDFYKALGNKIKILRKSKKYSQEKLAFEVDSSRNYIGCIERAEKFPSLGFILDIASVLNVEAKELFDFTF